MINKLRYKYRLCAILSLILLSATTMQAYALDTVSSVDLQRYLGKWYEIARFDAWFERDCTNVTAEYSLKTDGSINVLNSCHKYTPNGELKQSTGRATVVDTTTNAKLKVSFLPKMLSWFDSVFSGDYWVLKLEPDYSVVLVGEPSKKYLWILSRKPKLDQKTYDAYVAAAKQMGFDVTKLQKTEQTAN